MISPNVHAFLTRQAATHGPRPAIVSEGRTITFEELNETTARIAKGLHDQGIRAGDRVALMLPSIPEWVELYFACVRLGAIAVVINPRFRGHELGGILAKARPSAIAFMPEFKGVDNDAILAALPTEATQSLTFQIRVEDARPSPETRGLALSSITMDSLRGASGHPPFALSGDTPCAIFITSGTTSGPKLALHGQRGMLIHADDIARTHGFHQPGTVVLAALPLCGQFAFAYLSGALTAGAPTLITPGFEAGETADRMIRHGVTNMAGPDDLIRQLLAQSPDAIAFPDFRFAPYGCFNSQPEVFVPEADARGFTCVSTYGSTELQGLIAVRPADTPADVRMTGGGFLSNRDARMRVRDPDSGAILGYGQPGALEISTPTRMLRYFGDDEATVEAICDDGYFRTGDLAVTSADGSFTFVSRMNDALRLSGFLVNPLEISGFVETHPSVKACQVVEVATDKGNRPLAFVIAEDAAAIDEATLTEYCASALARFKIPVRFVVLDQFPTVEGPNGSKVQRQALKIRAAETFARGVAAFG